MIVSVELRGFEAPGTVFKRIGDVGTIIDKIKSRPVSVTVTETEPIKNSPIVANVLQSVEESSRSALTFFRIRYNNKPLDLAKTFVDYKIGNGAILIMDVLVQ